MLSSIQVAVLAPNAALRCWPAPSPPPPGVSALASGTFDSLSFPVFVIVFSAVIGLSAATWQVTQSRSRCQSVLQSLR